MTSDALAPSFARLLAARRANLGWSQQRLASTTGINQSLISGYEQGTHTPGLANALRLAEVLDFDLRDLYQGDSEND